MSTERVLEILLYERPGCGLCHEMLTVVEGLQPEFSLDVRRVDISADPGLEAEYGTQIPVLFIAGRKAFKYRVTSGALRARLLQALRARA